jgi:hypothetical protein
MINNVSDAIRVALMEINKKEKFVSYQVFEGEKGTAGVYVKTVKNVYCVKFQKSYFQSFAWLENGEEHKQIAICFRGDQLYECVEKKYTPMVILSDEKIYTYPAVEWLKWCAEHQAEGKNIIYKSIQRQNKTDEFTYYNIPISLVERYNPSEEEILERLNRAVAEEGSKPKSKQMTLNGE